MELPCRRGVQRPDLYMEPTTWDWWTDTKIFISLRTVPMKATSSWNWIFQMWMAVQMDWPVWIFTGQDTAREIHRMSRWKATISNLPWFMKGTNTINMNSISAALSARSQLPWMGRPNFLQRRKQVNLMVLCKGSEEVPPWPRLTWIPLDRVATTFLSGWSVIWVLPWIPDKKLHSQMWKSLMTGGPVTPFSRKSWTVLIQEYFQVK